MMTSRFFKTVLCCTLILSACDDSAPIGQDSGTNDVGLNDLSTQLDASQQDVSSRNDVSSKEDLSPSEDMSADVSSPPQDRLMAFPSAKGAGAVATGGRGGKVIHVTTLDWEGPGSLKEAIMTKGPRIIVFDVSGEIDASSQGDYDPIIQGAEFDNITIAGQSAPEGGITIRTNEFAFYEVDNVIIRYIRFRSRVGSSVDALNFQATSKVIFDHCNFSHGADEALSITNSVNDIPFGEITLQRSFIQNSKTGAILGGCGTTGSGAITTVNNLWSSISHRFPNPCGDGQQDIVNNVVYNHKARAVRLSPTHPTNFINNYYKPSTAGLRLGGWFGDGNIANNMHKVRVQDGEIKQIYASGAFITGQDPHSDADDRSFFTAFFGSSIPEYDPVPDRFFRDTQFPLAGETFEIKSAEETYADVVNDVGANKYLNADGSVGIYLDDKDSADIEMVKNDTYAGSFYENWNDIPYPTVPENTRPEGFDTDRDGMPDAWETSVGLDPTVDDSADDRNNDGYTNVEEFLYQVDL